ncbi:MAG TPA: ATP-binding protein [Anaerolineales bacterium]
MVDRLSLFSARLNLVQRFTIVGLIFMIAGSAGIGWWVGEQIKAGVIRETAATTALYMDSFIAPNLQELKQSDTLAPEHIATLTSLLGQTEFGSQIVAFKVWDDKGRIVYSDNPALIGRVFPTDEDVMRSWKGEIVASISDLSGAENVEERQSNQSLLQIYSPVRLNGTSQIIAVAEFYQSVDILNQEIAAAQRRSWLVVALTMLVVYLLLVGFVNWLADTIGRQKSELTRQVAQLTEVMAQNAELNGRVRRATANATALNERFLRRISAEFHDGPTQEISLAVLRLDQIIGESEADGDGLLKTKTNAEQLSAIQEALKTAITEMRTIAAGLGIPPLKDLPLMEVISRVVSSHERRTGTKVILITQGLPEYPPLPLKITVYRLIQEALNNAQRHAGGLGQQVRVTSHEDGLVVEVSDQGPGFDTSKPVDWDKHLGLAGMRDRVESMGGLFRIESEINKGTRVIAHLMLKESGVNTDG